MEAPITSVEHALEIASIGMPIDFFPSGVKNNTNPGWQNNCTIDLKEIIRRAEAEPFKRNFSIVAKAVPGGFLFLDDDGGIREEYEKIYGKMQATRKHRSCGGAYHYLFKHSARSLSFQKEINKAYIGEAKPNGGELWSLRMHNAYIVGPGSVAKRSDGTLGEYQVAWRAEVIEIPDTLLDFLIARYKATALKETNHKSNTWMDDPIPEGERNTKLFKIACALRNAGLDEDGIYAAMSVKNQNQCTTPIPEDELRALCHSAANYKPQPNVVIVNGKVAGSGTPISPQPSSGITREELEKLVDRSAIIVKPVFPEWVMQGTSLYKNLVKPTLDLSTKISYLVFMPAVLAYTNYLSTRVKLDGVNSLPLTLYLGLLGCKGTFKSSCAELAFDYFKTMGLLDRYSSRTTNANSRQLVFVAGSTEALGIGMEQSRCNNAILYYDELRKASKKMSIESSSFSGDLLTMYESGEFSNGIKNLKQSYTHVAGSYCVSWLFCSTIKAFNEVWPKIIGNNSDLLDRMFFVLGPESVNESDAANLYRDPDFINGCAETHALITKALEQKVYKYEDYEDVQQIIKADLKGLSTSDVGDGEDGLDLSMSRMVGLVQKLALYFAVDLGLDVVNSDCVERATALVRYRCQVIRYLRPIEANSILGQLQQLMLHTLRSGQGQMLVRDWKRNCHYDRHDTEIWDRAQKGLMKAEKIRFDTTRAETGHDHKMITLVKSQE